MVDTKEKKWSEKKWSFNYLTGEIKAYDTSEDFDADMSKGGFVGIVGLPKNCDSCYGRGYIGRDVHYNYYLPCKCILAKEKKNAISLVSKRRPR